MIMIEAFFFTGLSFLHGQNKPLEYLVRATLNMGLAKISALLA